jgi:hypothetical protein
LLIEQDEKRIVARHTAVIKSDTFFMFPFFKRLIDWLVSDPVEGRGRDKPIYSIFFRILSNIKTKHKHNIYLTESQVNEEKQVEKLWIAVENCARIRKWLDFT